MHKFLLYKIFPRLISLKKRKDFVIAAEDARIALALEQWNRAIETF